MALTSKKLALKKANREARRKKLSRQHQWEDKRISAGDFRTMGQVRKRKLKNRRNHHRPQEGQHTRKYKTLDAEEA